MLLEGVQGAFGFRKERLPESKWETKDPSLKIKIAVTDTTIDEIPEFSHKNHIPEDASRPVWHELGKYGYTDIDEKPKYEAGHFFCVGFTLMGREKGPNGKNISFVAHHNATSDWQKNIQRAIRPRIEDFLSRVEPGTVDAALYATSNANLTHGRLNGKALLSTRSMLTTMLGFAPTELPDETLRVPVFNIAADAATRRLWIIRSFK